eukprot:s3905_g5.t1
MLYHLLTYIFHYTSLRSRAIRRLVFHPRAIEVVKLKTEILQAGPELTEEIESKRRRTSEQDAAASKQIEEEVQVLTEIQKGTHDIEDAPSASVLRHLDLQVFRNYLKRKYEEQGSTVSAAALDEAQTSLAKAKEVNQAVDAENRLKRQMLKPVGLEPFTAWPAELRRAWETNAFSPATQPTKTVSAFKIKKNPVPLIAPLYSFSGESWWTVLTQSWDRLVVHPKFQDMDYLIPTVSSDFTGFISRPSQADRALRWLKDALHRGGEVEQDQIKNLSWHSFRVFIPDCAYQLGCPGTSASIWEIGLLRTPPTSTPGKNGRWFNELGGRGRPNGQPGPQRAEVRPWQELDPFLVRVPSFGVAWILTYGDMAAIPDVATVPPAEAKEIPYFVMAQMARDGYTSVEDLADRWRTINEARQDAARDLTFRHTDRNGILTQAQSQLIAVRLSQCVRQAQHLIGVGAVGAGGVALGGHVTPHHLMRSVIGGRSCNPGLRASSFLLLGSRTRGQTLFSRNNSDCAPMVRWAGLPANTSSALSHDVDERPIKTSKKTTVDGWEKEEEEEIGKPDNLNTCTLCSVTT